MSESNWNAKGAALSDKSAREEFGLTQEEIRDGTLQYRQNHIHGNPYLRLLRKEVEALVTELRGSEFLTAQKLRTELKSVETQIRSCKSKLKNLEKQKVRLSTDLEKMQTTT
jgi:septal ring factor EnvC (AmiA/AmiB activator)